MIIAGIRPPDAAEVARRLRERMAMADEVGEPRSGHHPTSGATGQESTDDPCVRDRDATN